MERTSDAPLASTSSPPQHGPLPSTVLPLAYYSRWPSVTCCSNQRRAFRGRYLPPVNASGPQASCAACRMHPVRHYYSLHAAKWPLQLRTDIARLHDPQLR
ncbi:hypothetical protein AcW1_000037 [Taiwanofungus camphoratus]|nr:hypothetical protein AcW1_000037 [Antrodia cinnamomea]